MPSLSVDVSGFGGVYGLLAAIPGAVQAALNASAPILSQEGTDYWRSIVRRKTGRMQSALSVQVQSTGGGISIYYFVSSAGYYYRFQSQSEQWSAQLAQFLAGRAGQVIAAEFQRALSRIGG